MTRIVTNRADVNPSTRAAGKSGRDPDYAALLRAAQGGNQHAMERLLMRAQEIAYRFSLLVCGHADDADDAMQEALLKTYRHAAQIKEPEAFRTWLYRTVKNACLISRRKRVHEPSHVHSLDEVVTDGDGGVRTLDVEDPGRRPDQILENRRLRRSLRRALQTLGPDYRLIVFLREVEGLSTREVATVMGISEANVKTRLHRARLSLQQQLEAP
ncbi:MAG: RNA polymerase sigma factor [Acidobacteria bacterium]|nr:RNA polymerase sigma factor [Acidobacteriota bacterium]